MRQSRCTGFLVAFALALAFAFMKPLLHTAFNFALHLGAGGILPNGIRRREDCPYDEGKNGKQQERRESYAGQAANQDCPSEEALHV